MVPLTRHVLPASSDQSFNTWHGKLSPSLTHTPWHRFDKAVPAVHPSKGAEVVQQLEAALQPLVQQYREAMDKIKFKEGLRTCMAMSSLGNKFFQARLGRISRYLQGLQDDPLVRVHRCACAGLWGMRRRALSFASCSHLSCQVVPLQIFLSSSEYETGRTLQVCCASGTPVIAYCPVGDAGSRCSAVRQPPDSLNVQTWRHQQC